MYSLPSVGPGADPAVQAVSPQVTLSESRHIPGSRLPLFSVRPAVTSVAFTRWRSHQLLVSQPSQMDPRDGLPHLHRAVRGGKRDRCHKLQ